MRAGSTSASMNTCAGSSMRTPRARSASTRAAAEAEAVEEGAEAAEEEAGASGDMRTTLIAAVARREGGGGGSAQDLAHERGAQVEAVLADACGGAARVVAVAHVGGVAPLRPHLHDCAQVAAQLGGPPLPVVAAHEQLEVGAQQRLLRRARRPQPHRRHAP